MPGIKITTDMGDWSTVPRRLQMGIVVMVVGAAAIGLGLAAGLLTLAGAIILLSGCTIGWGLVFDRRRLWWPNEPTVPDDPVGSGARRNIATAVLVAVVVLALVVAEVLQF